MIKCKEINAAKKRRIFFHLVETQDGCGFCIFGIFVLVIVHS